MYTNIIMKILITGCAGFIGFNIAKKILSNKKNLVYGVDSISSYYSIDLKKQRLSILRRFKNFDYIKKDLSKSKNVEDIFVRNKFDMVLHLAAQPGVRRSFNYPNEYYDANVSSFFNLRYSFVIISSIVLIHSLYTIGIFSKFFYFVKGTWSA